MKSNRRADLELIRIVAILLVIFNHTDGFIYYVETENILTWIFSVGMACICKIAVPLFFMVSGALLLAREETIKDLLCKRAARIFIVLFIVSLFYYIIDIYRYGMSNVGIEDFLTKFCNKKIRDSLWFLYDYFAILLILPFFRILIKHMNQKLMGYLFALKVIFSLVIPLLDELLGIFFYLNMGFVNEYIFYLILGYYMELGCDWRKKKQGIWLDVVCFVGCAVFDMVVMQVHFVKTGEYSQQLLELFLCIMAPSAFRICQRMADRWKECDKLNKVIVAVGQYVFGIYLLDNLVRWQLLPLYLYLSEKTIGVFACSVYVCATFTVGLIYAAALKKIPLVKRYL